MTTKTEPGRVSPVNRGFQAFQAMLASSFVPMHVTAPTPESFWSRTRSADTGYLTVTEITASPHAAERTPRDIDASDEPTSR